MSAMSSPGIHSQGMISPDRTLHNTMNGMLHNTSHEDSIKTDTHCILLL